MNANDLFLSISWDDIRESVEAEVGHELDDERWQVIRAAILDDEGIASGPLTKLWAALDELALIAYEGGL